MPETRGQAEPTKATWRTWPSVQSCQGVHPAQAGGPPVLALLRVIASQICIFQVVPWVDRFSAIEAKADARKMGPQMADSFPGKMYLQILAKKTISNEPEMQMMTFERSQFLVRGYWLQLFAYSPLVGRPALFRRDHGGLGLAHGKQWPSRRCQNWTLLPWLFTAVFLLLVFFLCFCLRLFQS